MRIVPVLRIVCDFIILLILWIPIPTLWYFGKPYERGFYCDDVSIRYPYKEGTISSAVLYSVGTILPVITIMLVEAYRVFRFEPRAFRGGEGLKAQFKLMGKPVHPYFITLYIYLGYFIFGMAINFLFTDLGKYTIGRPRPHFLSVCKPNWTLVNCTTANTVEFYNYIEEPHCTEQSAFKLKNARLSFPSGHASFSAYTMVYLVLYLHSRMIWPMGGFLLKHFLQFVALVLTVETSLSRVSDYKHHWSDVLAGFVLGTFDAAVVAVFIAGFFRRPQNAFGRPAPYDSRLYTGGQLYEDYIDEVKGTTLDLVKMKRQSDL